MVAVVSTGVVVIAVSRTGLGPEPGSPRPGLVPAVPGDDDDDGAGPKPSTGLEPVAAWLLSVMSVD